MNQAFQAIKVTDRVYWVGAIDWQLRDFHGYSTPAGTTYNAFLIVADEITLVDSVKAPFMDEMMSRIASVVDPSEIRNVISNHAEMDHSGCLPQLLHSIRPQRLIASAQGEKALREHFHWSHPVQVVADGERLSLGNAGLQFLDARMLHWPDSMFSYLEGDGVLFSNDAFGMHMASSERFADEVDESALLHEAAKYYANVILPFSPRVTKVVGKLRASGLEVSTIAPDHGPIWRQRPERILELYLRWAAQQPTRKAVVVFDTMWQSTARMAHAIAEGLSAGGIRVKVMPLDGTHRSDVAAELLEAGALLVGSPTMNNHMYPTVADVMTYLSGLRPKNLVGAAFGSYGWNPKAVADLEQALQAMGVELLEPGLRVCYVPDQEALAECRCFGAKVAARLDATVPEPQA
jgi:flavorubredoxin